MNLQSKLNKFETITLSEMDDVKLMSRTDTKFIFNFSRLPEFLEKLSRFYKVLLIDGNLIHDYKSLYFDTEDRKFYIEHHNRRVNRNKIRFREQSRNTKKKRKRWKKLNEDDARLSRAFFIKN